MKCWRIRVSDRRCHKFAIGLAKQNYLRIFYILKNFILYAWAIQFFIISSIVFARDDHSDTISTRIDKYTFSLNIDNIKCIELNNRVYTYEYRIEVKNGFDQNDLSNPMALNKFINAVREYKILLEGGMIGLEVSALVTRSCDDGMKHIVRNNLKAAEFYSGRLPLVTASEDTIVVFKEMGSIEFPSEFKQLKFQGISGYIYKNFNNAEALYPVGPTVYREASPAGKYKILIENNDLMDFDFDIYCVHQSADKSLSGAAEFDIASNRKKLQRVDIQTIYSNKSKGIIEDAYYSNLDAAGKLEGVRAGACILRSGEQMMAAHLRNEERTQKMEAVKIGKIRMLAQKRRELAEGQKALAVDVRKNELIEKLHSNAKKCKDGFAFEFSYRASYINEYGVEMRYDERSYFLTKRIKVEDFKGGPQEIREVDNLNNIYEKESYSYSLVFELYKEYPIEEGKTNGKKVWQESFNTYEHSYWYNGELKSLPGKYKSVACSVVD